MDLTQQHDHRLPDGRNLAYATWGTRGPVIFHYHGTGSSRFEAAALYRAAGTIPVRVIGVDRPGCGASSSDPKRDLFSFHADVENLANELGIDRFFVSGLSGGGAFACAAALSPRVIKSYPLNMSVDRGAEAARLVPFSLRFLIWLMIRPAVMLRMAQRATSDPLGRVRDDTRMPEIDKRILLEEVPDIWQATVMEGSRLGTNGIARDTDLLRNPWHLDWGAIKAPIEIHQGRLDPFREFPRALARTQPHVTLIEFEGGHHAALGAAVMRGIAEDVTHLTA